MDDPLRIDVWSDIACPWCYIGKRRLEAGIAALAEDPAAPPVVVEYHSFLLAPDTPEDFRGGEVDFLVDHKRLPVSEVLRMIDTVRAVAAGEGLVYDFDALVHVNTRTAHRLLHHARVEGRQAEMTERLLAAYFTEGRDLASHEQLADLAAEVGLDRDTALVVLRDGGHTEDVEADIATAGRLGIRGVPFHVLDGRYGISGAQPAELFAEALRRVAAERAAAPDR